MKGGKARLGQSTVEFAIVCAAFLSVVIALGSLWRIFDLGLVVDHALQSASHHLSQVASGAWLDVFLY
ncbi:MAG: TadE/TadG family type IV pilus assembly protein [Eggerthellaceae bacterium]